LHPLICAYIFGVVTILEVIQRSTEFLAKRGVDSPRLQAELLLAHTLHLPRLHLYLNFGRELTDAELETIRAFIKRRSQREPLQHILGSTSFCGIEIAVDASVLTPRPETEVLAELAWQHMNRRAETTSIPTALDFGTGSGCLAILLASKSPAARVLALDVSPAALDIARANAQRQNLLERITFLESDGFSCMCRQNQFDLIVANPPYIPTAEIAQLEAEVRDFDPHLALDGGTDGLTFFRRLATDAPPFLKPDGQLMAEFGDGQAEEVSALFAGLNWRVEPIIPDLSGRPRILIASPPQA
jgi:release factor glutamine methyltransferase